MGSGVTPAVSIDRSGTKSPAANAGSTRTGVASGPAKAWTGTERSDPRAHLMRQSEESLARGFAEEPPCIGHIWPALSQGVALGWFVPPLQGEIHCAQLQRGLASAILTYASGWCALALSFPHVEFEFPALFAVAAQAP